MAARAKRFRPLPSPEVGVSIALSQQWERGVLGARASRPHWVNTRE